MTPPPPEPAKAHDHYAAARRLVAALRREGIDETARTLDDTIAAGFTSTEILMGLRWHIDRFLDGDPACSTALLREARELRGRIDAALS